VFRFRVHSRWFSTIAHGLIGKLQRMSDGVAFLALGDSYTVGESVATAQSWPHRLAVRCADAGYPMTVRVVAATGWTSGELLAAIEADPPAPVFDVVSLLIGVNDQYRGLPLGSFQADLARLLDWTGRCLRPGGAGRFAVSIPDWSATPFASNVDRAAVARDIDHFNAAFRSGAEAAGLPFVDVTALSRRPDAGVAGDGLHPSSDEYARWVDEILPVALRLLDGEV
jgi:lysophospholipase L1-like esterase